MELGSSSYCSSSMMNHQYHHQSQPLYQNYHSPKQRCISTLEEVKSLIINLRTKKKKKEMDSAINKIEEVIQTIKVTMSDSTTPALRPIDQIILEKLEKIESKSKPIEGSHSMVNNKPVSPTTVLLKPTDETISPQQLGAKLIDLIKNDSTLKLETTTIGTNGIQLSSFHSDIKNKIENLIKQHHLDSQVDLIELKKMSPQIDLTITSKPRFEREDLYKELTKRTAERHSSLSRQGSESSSGSETYMDGQGRLFRTPSATTPSSLSVAPTSQQQHTYDSSSVNLNNGSGNMNTYNSLNNINIYESNQMIHMDESIYGRSKRSYPHLPPKPLSVNVGGGGSSCDYGVTGRISGITSDINRRVSNHDVLYSIDASSSSASSSVSTSQFNRGGDCKINNIKDNINGGHTTSSSVSSTAVSEECQQICAIFGDLSTSNGGGGGESNLACSEGSITPTNPDRSSSPTNENSPSSLTSSTSSSTNRDPVQFSALKSAKSFPGNPIAESLYSSTGTLSRSSNKPAPPPPVRKTSSISDPNAITLGTLRNAGCSTYEEIKTLKRNVRNHSGNGGYNTYEELNSDRNAVYHAARKSCLSTSLTSLVEPIYSTLDSNTISISNPFNSKIVTINTSSHRVSRRDEPCSKSYSATTDSLNHQHQHSTSTASRPPSSATLSNYQSSSLMKQRNDDDSLPPPPPEAYIDSSGDNHHNSHNRIVLTRREFLQTLNAKLSVPQNQRVSPKLVKRRSMSLPHSDQEWDSDSGITTQSSSSGESGSLGSSTQSESFTQSLVNQLTWWSKF